MLGINQSKSRNKKKLDIHTSSILSAAVKAAFPKARLDMVKSLVVDMINIIFIYRIKRV